LVPEIFHELPKIREDIRQGNASIGLLVVRPDSGLDIDTVEELTLAMKAVG
jgi:hypothetical protein